MTTFHSQPSEHPLIFWENRVRREKCKERERGFVQLQVKPFPEHS